MTVQHLYDTYFGTWDEAAVGTQTVGVRWSTTVSDLTVTGLRWRRMNAGSGRTPVKLALWDTTTGMVVAEPSSIVDSGVAGWQVSPLAAPFTPAADRVYVVAAGFTNPSTRGNQNTGTPPAPPAPLAWGTVGPGCYNGSSATGYPDTSFGYYYPVDIETGDWFPPAPADTDQISYAELRDELVRWFSASTPANTHTADTPYVTRADVAAIKSVTDVLADIGSGAIGWLNTRATDAVDLLNGVNASAIAALNDLAARITGSGAGGGSAFYSSDSRQVAQSAADTYDAVALLLALRRNALVGFPGAPWVMTDETAFDTDIAYTEAADLYVVTFTGLGSNLVNTVVAGVDVSYRLAWWTPLIGAFAQQRRFIDTPSAHLWLDGTRLPGVLLHSPAGAAGTIQAWLYA